MKIEKLTENKIRVIVNPSDLGSNDLDIHLLMNKALEGHQFFANMLEKAKKEVGFDTDGCKLLIETFSSPEDFLVFTITKSSPKELKEDLDFSKKKLTVKRRTLSVSEKNAIYKFSDFDTLCNFCHCIANKEFFNINKLSKDISLYLYNGTYYLIIKNINTTYAYVRTFYSVASEFLIPVRFSDVFLHKLSEYGKVIMKKNAISLGIKYFVS